MNADQRQTVTQQGGHYRTSDLYYAAYLKVAGVPFHGTTKEGSRTFFLFEDGENLRELKDDYYTRKAKVSALSHADEIKVMKRLTHED